MKHHCIESVKEWLGTCLVQNCRREEVLLVVIDGGCVGAELEVVAAQVFGWIRLKVGVIDLVNHFGIT